MRRQRGSIVVVKKTKKKEQPPRIDETACVDAGPGPLKTLRILDPKNDNDSEPIPTPASPSTAPDPSTICKAPGEREFFDSLDKNRQSKLLALPYAKASECLYRGRKNPAKGVTYLDAEPDPRTRPLTAGPPPTAGVEELLVALEWCDDPASPQRAARALMDALGDHSGSWKYVHGTLHEVWESRGRRRSADLLVEAYRRVRTRMDHPNERCRPRKPAAYFVRSYQEQLSIHASQPQMLVAIG